MCGYECEDQNCMHLSKCGGIIEPRRVIASIYLLTFITSRLYFSVSVFQPHRQLHQHLLASAWVFSLVVFFFLGHQSFSTHLHSANSHFFYLTWPWPSRLCVLFPYTIMWCHLERNSSYCINMSPCKTIALYFQQQAQCLPHNLYSICIY